MWLVDVDGKNEQRVDDGDHLSAPAWAPDGKRLAWLHPVPDLSQPAEYRVADAKGMKVKMIPQPAAPREERPGTPGRHTSAGRPMGST